MNALSIPVIVADAVSAESVGAVPAPASGERAKDPGDATVKEQKEQAVASNAKESPDDVDALSDSAILALEDAPAAPAATASGVRSVVLEDAAKPWRASPPPVPLMTVESTDDEASAPDAAARDSTAPTWMSTRKGAKPPGAILGASTIFFFVALVLAIAGSSVLALTYVSPDAQSRTRTTAARRIEATTNMLPTTATVPVAADVGPTLPVIVAAPEDPPAAQPQPAPRPASAAPVKQPAPAASPIRPAPAKAHATVAQSSNAKRSTPGKATTTTTRARLSITKSPY